MPVPGDEGSVLLQQLGLSDRADFLGAAYIDMARGDAEQRSIYPEGYKQFATRKIDDANLKSTFAPNLPSLPAWLMLGAIREDDVPFDPGEEENTPQDEPWGPFARVLHHFFDPYNNRSLTVATRVLGTRAPDWAIDGSGDIYGSANGFSIGMAREAMWRASTLKHAPGTAAASGFLTDLSFEASAGIPTREAMRIAYWATVFRSLGSAVHLLQDMAQPQHTRNDAHAGLGCVGSACAGGHRSYYESYVEARVKGAKQFRLRERALRDWLRHEEIEDVAVLQPVFQGYPIPRFDGYRDYYSAATGSSSLGGSGLANYSNRGFYSAGTNALSVEAFWYASPAPNAAALGVARIPAGSVRNASDERVDRGALDLYSGPVPDTLNPTFTETAVLTTRGAFDQFMRPSTHQYSLNHYVYRDQARLLLPRAVAYSAGLIDYFFRGSMAIGLPDGGVYAAKDAGATTCAGPCGFDRLKLKLQNTTPDETMGPGTLVAVVKFHRNACYRADLSGDPGGANFAGNSCRVAEEEIVVSEAKPLSTLASDASATIDFTFQSAPIPINATDVSLQVVFRGALGEEADAVVVTTRNIAETQYVALENSTDYRFNSSTGIHSLQPVGDWSVFADIKVSFGSANPPKPVATVAQLTAPGYVQLAYLTDAAELPLKIDFAATQISGGYPLRLTLPAFEFYLPKGADSIFTNSWPVAPVRGMLRRFAFRVSTTQDASVYLCSTEFNPQACDESSLSPLTAANGGQLTIDLQ